MQNIEKELLKLDNQLTSIIYSLKDCQKRFGGRAPLGFSGDEFRVEYEKLSKGSLVETKNHIDYVSNEILRYVENLSNKLNVNWQNTDQVLSMERGNPFKSLVAQFKGFVSMIKGFDRMFPDSMEQESLNYYDAKNYAKSRSSYDEETSYGSRVNFGM